MNRSRRQTWQLLFALAAHPPIDLFTAEAPDVTHPETGQLALAQKPIDSHAVRVQIGSKFFDGQELWFRGGLPLSFYLTFSMSSSHRCVLLCL